MADGNRYHKCKFDDTEIIRIPLPGGASYEFILAGNIMWPTNFFTSGFAPDIRENLEKIRCMNCEDNDVVICAYPRSGTHWVWEICNMLLRGKAEYLSQPKHSTTLEYHWPEEFHEVTRYPRVFNTHLHYDNLPHEIIHGGKGKLVFVTRNPKDVAVSLYHHAKNSNHAPYKGDFTTFLEAFQSKDFMYKWFDYTKEFESVVQQPNKQHIHVIQYEELKQNAETEIRKLAEFLETSYDEILIRQIVDKCSFQRFKAASDITKENNRCCLQNVYKDPKLNIRKGEIGDWKNYFTVSQSETFDTIYRERMPDSDLKFKYSWNDH